MNKIAILLCTITMCFLSFECTSTTKQLSTNQLIVNDVDKVEIEKIAVTFLNTYSSLHIQQVEDKNIDIQKYIHSDSDLSEEFLTAYRKLYQQTEQEEYIDADPILNAQDVPENGFKVKEINQNGSVLLEAIDWNEFKVSMQFVKQHNRWKIQSCGAILPEK